MNEPIQEKTANPPGLLPKHVQSWLILGLAVLMVAITWLTGGKKQPTVPKTNASMVQTPLPLEVNETKITELQNRIQELQREQLAAQSALVQQNRFLGTSPEPHRETSVLPEGCPLTVREAAKYLGVSPQTVYLWVERKQIPHLRVMGRNIRFLKSDLETFRASFRQEMENA